ncbi:MAG: type II toxin-antitoxin system RelE/ParE family toxin [Pseudomonadota bacterium]
MLDKTSRMRIARFIDERLIPADDPRDLGKPLTGTDYRGVWRYRVGDYRLLTRIEDRVVTIIVLKIGHRSDVYRERR